MPHLLVPMRLHHFAHQRLIGPKAIQGGGVEKFHTVVERGQQHTLALLG